MNRNSQRDHSRTTVAKRRSIDLRQARQLKRSVTK